MTVSISFQLNGASTQLDVAETQLLCDAIRQHGSTGTHVGCDTSQCGACVVHVDGKSVKSCTMLAVQANGKSVTTIEGLAGAAADQMHPMQEAFKQHHGLQCGFCTPGMVMSAIDLINHNPEPTETQIRDWLEGNICRCTGYHNIVKAVKHGAQMMREV